MGQAVTGTPADEVGSSALLANEFCIGDFISEMADGAPKMRANRQSGSLLFRRLSVYKVVLQGSRSNAPANPGCKASTRI